MKTRILTFLFSSFVISGWTQQAQFRHDSIMSCYPGDWDKYHYLTLTLSPNSPTTVSLFTYVYRNDSLIMNTDSDYAVTALLDTPSTTLTFNQVLPCTKAEMYEGLVGHFFENSALPEGNYRVVVYYAALGSQTIDSAATEFYVSPYTAHAPYTPYNNAHIYIQYMQNVYFAWEPVTPHPGVNVNYEIVIKRRYPGQTEEEAMENNDTLIYADRVVNLYYELTPNDLQLFTAPSNQKYVWAVQSRWNDKFGEPIGNKRGVSDVYSFRIGYNSSEDEILVRQSDTGWCRINNFELGTVEGWNYMEFSFEDSDLTHRTFLDTSINDFPDSQRNHVTSPTTDYWTNVPKVPSNGGTHSLRVSDSVINSYKRGDIMQYMYAVGNSNKVFDMNYALTLSDGHHQTYSEGRANIMLWRGRKYSEWDMIHEQIHLPDTGNSYYKRSVLDQDVVFTDWKCLRIDMEKRLGQNITINLGATDCAHGGNFNYLYADFCNDNEAVAALSTQEIYCYSDSLNIDPSGSINESAWFVSLEESDQWWGRNPETELWKWYDSSAPTNYNLKNLFDDPITNFGGLSLKCNTYYRVKVAAINECSPWNEVVKLIYISCPAAGLAGPDRCCDNPPIFLGDSSSFPAFTYQWFPTQYLTAPTAPITEFVPTGSVIYPKTYYLSVTDTLGCTTQDSATVFCSASSCSVIYDTSHCNNKLYTLCNVKSEVSWQIKDYTPNGWIITTVLSDTLVFNPRFAYAFIRMVVNNPCGNHIDSSIILHRKYKKFDDTLMIDKELVARGGDPLIVYDLTSGIPGTRHAYYNALAYRLHIEKSDGTGYKVFDTIVFADPDSGFKNGDVRWNKTNNQSLVFSRVETGIYWCLVTFQFCPGEPFIEMRHHVLRGLCIKKKRWSHKKCKKWAPYTITTDNPIMPFSYSE